jgi:hypothetical protein
MYELARTIPDVKKQTGARGDGINDPLPLEEVDFKSSRLTARSFAVL